MRISYLLFLLLVGIQQANAQSTRVDVLSSNEHEVWLDVYPGALHPHAVPTPDGLAYQIGIANGHPYAAKGCPALPQLVYSICIPGMSGTTVSVEQSEFQDQPAWKIAPDKGRISRDTDPSKVPYWYGPVYQQNQFYPASLVESGNPYILRDLRGESLHIFPVQYNPVSQVMRVYTHLKIKISFDGTNATNTLATEMPSVINEAFEGIYRNHFINYEKHRLRYMPVTETGSMLILCPAAYITDITSFIKWKEMKGIKTYLVNTDTLSGGATEITIKALVHTYYQEKQIAYLLLVGDNTNITPFMTAPAVAGPSDIAYGYQVGNDHYPDISVGRFSGETNAEIQTQVQRTLAYEQNPDVSTNWMRTQIGIGSEFGVGDDNQYDFEHIHDIVDSNKNQYTYLVNVEEYDDTVGTTTATLLGTDQLGNPNAAMLTDAINTGASLINYCGHGGPDGIVTDSFSSTDVPSLHNARQLPFFFVVGCSPGDFVSYTCFAERMQRAASPTSEPYGTISSFMSSISQYWDEPMQAQDEFNAILRGARPSDLKSRLGPMCVDGCMSMNDQYNIVTDPTAGSDMTDTWIFFGDPTVSIFTKNTGTLSISYDVHIQQNSTTYQIHCPVDGATIGLYYQGHYLASSTVYGGMAYFNFPALTVLDTVYITATKQNYVPANGKAIVVNWPTALTSLNASSDLHVYPNPASDELFVEVPATVEIQQIQLTDVAGNIVEGLAGSGHQQQLSIRSLASGTYILQVMTNAGQWDRLIQK